MFKGVVPISFAVPAFTASGLSVVFLELVLVFQEQEPLLAILPNQLEAYNNLLMFQPNQNNSMVREYYSWMILK